MGWNTARFLGSAGVNYSGKAFWSDVLSAPFHGFTDAYTMVNASFGVKWAQGRVTTSLKGTNLTNQEIQQHIFGDIIKRSISRRSAPPYDDAITPPSSGARRATLGPGSAVTGQTASTGGMALTPDQATVILRAVACPRSRPSTRSPGA